MMGECVVRMRPNQQKLETVPFGDKAEPLRKAYLVTLKECIGKALADLVQQASLKNGMARNLSYAGSSLSRAFLRFAR